MTCLEPNLNKMTQTIMAFLIAIYHGRMMIQLVMLVKTTKTTAKLSVNLTQKMMKVIDPILSRKLSKKMT